MSEATHIFEILMRENAEMLLAFLRASINDPHAVDDIFQETMVVAWRRLEDFDRNRSFGKWIRGIAGNLMLVHYRKSGRNPLSFDESTLEWMENRFAQIQRIQGDTLSEKLDLLRECVARLSNQQRATIEARYLNQDSLDDIGKQMGAGLETVKKRLYRAKLQLEKCINNKLLALEESA
jgi:RNA polymerase sigma-70 factor (ECF subfamily)